MPLDTYDSPTFLGSKDKYLLGLSLPELFTVIAVAISWLVASLMLPYGTLVRIIVAGVATLVTSFLIFARVYGLSTPMCVFYIVKGLFVKPSYEEMRELLLGGNLVWLEQQENSGRWYRFSFFRMKKSEYMDSEQGQTVRMEVQAEVSRSVNSGAVAVERGFRDALKAIFSR